jgi:Lrp/AsnC family transcriptional regulator of ectoine degradation
MVPAASTLAGPSMAAVKLDPLDLKILAILQREGRVTKAALAERIGLSPTPCWLRLKRLEASGIVTGYHARLSLRPLGWSAMVLMEVTLERHGQADFDRFERAVRAVPEIVGCWAVGGGIDYLLRILTRDIDAYQRLVDSLLESEIGIDRYFTYIVMKTVKDDAVLPIDELLAEDLDRD